MPSRQPGAAIACLFLLLAFGRASWAQSGGGVKAAPAKKPAAAAPKKFVPHNETLKEAVAQADGITDAVTDRLWVETDRYWHHGDYYRIVDLLRICVEIDPTWTDAYGNAAWLLWSLGDNTAANRLLKYGTDKKPALWDLQYEFGFHLYLTKSYADALPYLKAATANKNADAIAWKTLAHCYDKLGRTAESVATWQTVVKRFPNDVAGPHNLAEMKAKLKAEKGGRASAAGPSSQ